MINFFALGFFASMASADTIHQVSIEEMSVLLVSNPLKPNIRAPLIESLNLIFYSAPHLAMPPDIP
jgi:hypothetical protein